jgi:hypothetical protein
MPPRGSPSLCAPPGEQRRCAAGRGPNERPGLSAGRAPARRSQGACGRRGLRQQRRLAEADAMDMRPGRASAERRTTGSFAPRLADASGAASAQPTGWHLEPARGSSNSSWAARVAASAARSSQCFTAVAQAVTAAEHQRDVAVCARCPRSSHWRRPVRGPRSRLVCPGLCAPPRHRAADRLGICPGAAWRRREREQDTREAAIRTAHRPAALQLARLHQPGGPGRSLPMTARGPGREHQQRASSAGRRATRSPSSSATTRTAPRRGRPAHRRAVLTSARARAVER